MKNGFVRDGHRSLQVKGRGWVPHQSHAKAFGDTVLAPDERDAHAEIVAVLHGAAKHNGLDGTVLVGGGRQGRFILRRRQLTHAAVALRQRGRLFPNRWRNQLTDLVKGQLKILSCRQIKDGQRTHLLLAVIRQLTKELVAVNKGSTHGGNRNARAARVEDESVLGRINLVLLQDVAGGVRLSSQRRRRGSGDLGLRRRRLVKGRHGGLGGYAAKFAQRPDAVLGGKVSHRLRGLGTVRPASNQLHLLHQLVAVTVKVKRGIKEKDSE